ncbi:hypothetical protein NIES4106_62270 (plasmid) [Fischerella sp. NIES-4106]|nr:hypothetical protein NIES4106_62270 [Fischerella sp. NIES-4106]
MKSGLPTRDLQIKGLSNMKTLTTSSTPSNIKASRYYEGEFDAAIGLPPRSQNGDYQSGYLNKVRETGEVPF